MSYDKKIYSCALLSLLGVGLTAQIEVQDKAQQVERVQVSQEARAEMAAAKQLVTALKGVRGEERTVGLSNAAMAYEAVAKKFSDQASAVAAALYESGEAWRRHGSLDKAENAYRKVVAQKSERYLGRATFQLAQMERRQKRFEDAIKTYQLAAQAQPKLNRANEARLWIARCYASLEMPEESMQSFRAAVERAATSRQLIEACNYLAKELCKRGELEAATAAIAKADKHVAPLIEAGGEDSEGLRTALDRMSARKTLAEAMDKANGAAGDARQLESDRRRANRPSNKGLRDPLADLC